MNTMELNKIAAAVLVSGVVLMTSGFLATLIVPDPTAHGGGHHGPNMFAGLTPAEKTESSGPAGPEPIAPLMADASVDAGAATAKKCMSCHTFEQGGGVKVGPNLHGVLGRDIASTDFSYSSALSEHEGNWTYEKLNHFIYKPRDFAPGTKMTFAGLSKASDRANVIAFLRSNTENPPPLPEPEPVVAEAGGEGQAAAEGDAKTEGGAEGGAKAPATADGGAETKATGGEKAPAQESEKPAAASEEQKSSGSEEQKPSGEAKPAADGDKAPAAAPAEGGATAPQH